MDLSCISYRESIKPAIFMDMSCISYRESTKPAIFMDMSCILNCAPKVGHNKFKHERIKVSN